MPSKIFAPPAPPGTESLWVREEPLEEAPAASLDGTSCDVCVVGAGIAGLSVAYALARAGRSVIVVDDGPIGGGETGRTSAHLTSALDDGYAMLERTFGEAGARTAATAHAAAIDSIEQIVAEWHIDCDFRRVDGYLFAPADGAGTQDLDRELEAARRAGLTVEKLERAPLPFATGAALRFADQAQFQPLAYLRGLAAALRSMGATIATGAHVLAIEPPDDDDVITVRTEDDAVISARFVVDATNASITSRYDLPLRQAAYRSYVVALAAPAGTLPTALFWDTEDPYHYIRVHGDVVLVGGRDHRTGHGSAEESLAKLEAWARERIPNAGATVASWSGQIMEPAAGLGYVGRTRLHDRVFVVSGDSGDGLTNGALAGILIPALIADGDHPWASVFDPRGNHWKGIRSLIREGAASSSGYADWLRAGEGAPSAGAGAVVRHGVHLIAVYRDPAGTCHLRSARCPHAQGVVRWNAAERSWDCTCHGSRFDAYGRVINAPTAHALPELDEKLAASVTSALEKKLLPEPVRAKK